MKKLALVMALVIMLAIAGMAQAADYILKIGHAGPASDMNDDYIGSTSLKKYIEEKSGGKIKVDIYPGNQLGNYQEMMEQVEGQVLECVHTSIGGITPFMPELSVVDLQFLIPGDEVVYKLMDGPFFDAMREAVTTKLPNVRLVGVSDGGRWRSFYTTNKQIRSAADLKGMKIRTINSPLQQEFVNTLGASATPIAWGELYTALATGLVDGTKNATPDIMSNKFNESIKYGTLDRHTFLFGFYWLSDSWLKSLPADLQQIVLDGFDHCTEQQTMFNKAQEDKANTAFEAAGGTIYIPNKAEWQTFADAAAPMKEWYVKKYGDAWLKKLEEAVEIAKKEAGK